MSSRATTALDGAARRCCASPTRRVWVDLAGPSPAQVEAGRRSARPPPADRRGRPRGQPAGQDRDDRRHRPHRPVPPDYGDVGRRVRARHRPRRGLPAHRPRRRLGPARGAPPARRRRAGPARTGRTTCCGRSPTTSSTATSRSPTGSATPSTTSRTQVIRKATPDTVERLFKLKRELIQVRRAISPVREVFNQLTNRDEHAHRRRRDRLLPRHLRPRHPADRRARQLPRARVVDARRLPDPGQQQPVGDHEAADRGDGHPRRDRGGRRDLRDERGGHGLRRRGGGRVLGRHRGDRRPRGRARPCSCAGSTGSEPRQPQTTGCGRRMGGRRGRRARLRAASRSTWVLPKSRPRPSDVWSQSCSLLAFDGVVEAVV